MSIFSKILGTVRQYRKYFIVFSAIFFLALTAFIYSVEYQNFSVSDRYEGYKVEHQTGGDLFVGDGAQCHRVINSSNKDYFVPTKTYNEWNAFSEHLPPGVSVSNCCSDTCQSEGYECGTHTICGENVDCGSCGSHASCSFGHCACDSGWSDCDGDGSCECNNSSSHCAGPSCVANGTSCSSLAGQSCGDVCSPGTYDCNGVCVRHNAAQGVSCGANGRVCDGNGSCCMPIVTADDCPTDGSWCGTYDDGCGGTVTCATCPTHQECDFTTGTCGACQPEPCSTTNPIHCQGESYLNNCGEYDPECVGTQDCDAVCYTSDDCPSDPNFCGVFANTQSCIDSGYPATVTCGNCAAAHGNNANWYCGDAYQCTCDDDLTCPLSKFYCQGDVYNTNCGRHVTQGGVTYCQGTHSACTANGSDDTDYAPSQHCAPYYDDPCDQNCPFYSKSCSSVLGIPTHCVGTTKCCWTQQSCRDVGVCGGTYNSSAHGGESGCPSVTCTPSACSSNESCYTDDKCHTKCGSYNHGDNLWYNGKHYYCCDGVVCNTTDDSNCGC